MVRKSLLRGLEEDLGDLLEEHERTSDLQDFTRYEDDPVGFIEEVLEGDLTSYQEEIARGVLENPLVTIRSCHAAGKDWLAARLALWWVYARHGLVVLTGPTRAQVEEILMRGEVRDAFQRAGDLPGSLHVNALRPGGEGRAGILAKTATGVSALTGFHESKVLFVITEAQDPEIGHAWDAAFGVATGEHDRILTLGNPVMQSGRFYRAHQPRSDWRAFKIAAEDVPNVQAGETVVAGLLTREGVERFASEYGESSGFYKSRVLAEFPEQSEEGLIRRSWLEEAADRWEEAEFYRETRDEEPIAGLDPARHGADSTVLVVRRGRRLEGIESWGRGDTMETVETAGRHLEDAGITRRSWDEFAEEWEPGSGDVVVDEVGVGAGVADRLEELRFNVSQYNGGKSPRDGDRFLNVRAESYWELRERLEEGRISLPRNEALFQELLALRWRPTAAGKIQLEAKEDLKNRLGRSPDRADAVVMAFYSRSVRGRSIRDLKPLKAHHIGGRG